MFVLFLFINLISTRNNGVESFLCGALYDYGYAGDENYAHEIHHRLFERTNRRGQTIRHDIVALNICRAREHGIPGYNRFRQICGLPRAEYFEQLTDTMAVESIEKLKRIYK
jgi:peroxidase